MKTRVKIKNFKGGPKNFFFMIFLFAICLLMLARIADYAKNPQYLSYDEFINQVKNNLVSSVTIDNKNVAGLFKDGRYFRTVLLDAETNSQLLLEHKVKIDVVPPAHPATFWYFVLFTVFGLVGMAVWFLYRQMRGSGSNSSGNMFNFGKNKSKMFSAMEVKTTFNNVAGAHEAKEELKDVVDFLKNPEKYKRLGAKLTRGVLLTGEPGNGKTLLARAVAGEAHCPFFSISGSDFIEVFVGVGAARVRDLFAQARKHSPSIIFIDEIDAIGRQRATGLSGGHEEREQTLNQLLAEMDGFDTSSAPVIVLAATNRADILDKALLRPGRFDKKVFVPFPDLKSREEILAIHMKNVKVNETVDINKLARATPGFSGADLANLINEAAIHASKMNKSVIDTHDFEEAHDKIILGRERTTVMMTEEELNITAYHEAGHTLALLMQPQETEPLHKVTIIPRGHALGLTCWLPLRDKYVTTKDQYLASIVVACGGRAAEELVFNIVSSGPYSDFQTATATARQMVRYLGMADSVGPVIYQNDADYSPYTAQQIDQAVREIIDSCYQKSRSILIEHRDKLDLLAAALRERETMQAAEIYELLGLEPRESIDLKQ